MIERLARALLQAGVDTDAVQLAEILWVATRRQTAGRSAEHAEPPEGVEPLAEAGPAPTPAAPGGPRPEVTPAAPPMYLVPAQPVSGEAVEVRLPAPVALPERLRLGRALRAFKRRHPVPRLREFDLDGTIELYGATRLLTPLTRHGSERWFDVTMVVDAGPTMDVWAQTTAELAKLLAGHGAFRRVERLRLVFEAGQPWLLTDADQRHHPRRVGSHDRRQLTLVISDCVGTPWYRDEVWRMIRDWGRRGPVVLVQTLPARLWESTALGPADVRVTGYRPGQPNTGLRVSWPWWSISEVDEQAGVLPVVGLNELDLALWARMVMGGADASVAGVLAEPAEPWLAEPTDAPAAARVSMFKSTVSAEAYQLAVCLAAVPIRLPVARMVQYAILGSRDPVHLAEVFASGLISRLTPTGSTVPPDEVAYDFVPGVREVLQGSLTGTRTLEIFRAVAQYLERTIGASASFTALLTGATGRAEVDPAFLPFAEVGAQLLDRLGLRSTPLPEEPPAAPSLLPWAHVILIGPHDLEEFWVWLVNEMGFPVERITWLRNDHGVPAFQQAVRTAAAQRPVSGLLFVLLAGKVNDNQLVDRGFASALRGVPGVAVFSSIVTVTLTDRTPKKLFSGRIARPSAFLGHTQVSISELIDALSDERLLASGITTATVDGYLSAVSRSTFSAVDDWGIVLRPGVEPPLISRRRALVVGVDMVETDRLATRLLEIGYEVRTLLCTVSSAAFLHGLQELMREVSEQDLLWLHISMDRGAENTHDDVEWFLVNGDTLTLTDIREPLVQSGAGAVVITSETQRFTRSNTLRPLPVPFVPSRSDRTPNFLQISTFADHKANSLPSALLAGLAQTPYQTELRTLLDPKFLPLHGMSVLHWGPLNVPLAADPALQADPDLVAALGIEMIDIPAGSYFRGHTESQLAEAPRGEHLPEPSLGTTADVPAFSISRFPITNRQFAEFVGSTSWKAPSYWDGLEPPEELADHPVTLIRWGKARAFCDWLAQRTGLPFRLPTALEWEKAARGTDARKFPWGDEFDPSRCSHRRRRTVPVHQFSPMGDSPYGVADMVGNVREWTSTGEQSYWNTTHRVCGGGMHAKAEHELWCNHQTTITDAPKVSIGFRIALSRP